MPDETIHSLHVELTKLTGEVALLRGAVEAGDKQNQQLVELLKPRMDAQDKGMERLEGLFRHHESTEHAPHDNTLGTRVGRIENKLAFYAGSLAVLGLASPIAAALLTKQLGG